MQDITKIEITTVLDTGELSPQVLNTSLIIVAVFTQSWCSDWHRARLWLGRLAPDLQDVSILVSEYDKDDSFTALRTLKEMQWQNPLIPYFRFYRSGVLQETCNVISERKFLRIIDALRFDS